MDSCEYFPEPQNAYDAFIIDKYLKRKSTLLTDRYLKSEFS